MRKRFTKLFVLVAFVASLIITNVTPLAVFAAADTCTWTGITSANWATGSNWTGCDNGGVPENGDALIFPSGASNKASNNNLSSLQIASITINGTGYSLAGNAFTITGITAITANESATISANVTYNSGSHVTILAEDYKTLTLSGATNLVLTGFYEVNIGSTTHPGIVDFTGNITGDAAAQFIAVDGAVAIVRGSSNTFSSDLVGAESGGTFECRSANCFGNAANTIYTGGGVVRMFTSAVYNNTFTTSAPASNNAWLVAYEDISITGDGTVNDSLGISQDVAGKSLQFTGAVTLNEGISTFGADSTSLVRFDGAISGAGGIAAGSGTTRLAGASTFQDTVFVNDGAIVMATTMSALGSDSGATVVLDGGSLVFNTASQFTTDEPITITGDGNTDSAGAIRNDGLDNVTVSGNITLAGDATVRNTAADTTLELGGVISGSHDLTYQAVPSAYIQVGDSGGLANTYTGTTNVAGGVVYLEKSLAVPGNLVIDSDNPSTNAATVYTYAPNAIADSATVSLSNENDELRIGDSGTVETIGGLEGEAGLISFQYGDSDLSIDQDFDSTFGGNFYADGESPTVTKRGAGNLTLTGEIQWNLDDDINFVVEEGTLTVNGSLKTDGGTDLSVEGTGTLKGTGTVGNLSSTSGTIAAGNSPGTLSVTTLTMGPDTVFEQEIAGNIAGTGYDQVVASGAVNLGNANLSIQPSYTPAVGEVFTIITGSSVTGTFKNLPEGSTVTSNGVTFRVNYTATSVTLTFTDGSLLASTGMNMVPVVTVGALIAVAGAAVLARRRYLLR